MHHTELASSDWDYTLTKFDPIQFAPKLTIPCSAGTGYFVRRTWITFNSIRAETHYPVFSRDSLFRSPNSNNRWLYSRRNSLFRIPPELAISFTELEPSWPLTDDRTFAPTWRHWLDLILFVPKLTIPYSAGTRYFVHRTRITDNLLGTRYSVWRWNSLFRFLTFWLGTAIQDAELATPFTLRLLGDFDLTGAWLRRLYWRQTMPTLTGVHWTPPTVLFTELCRAPEAVLSHLGLCRVHRRPIV